MSLLVLAIAVYGFRIEVVNADPQRGSAFAMFATVDIGATRRVIATAPGETAITLAIPDELSQVRERVLDAPTDGSARMLATLLLERSWLVEGDTAVVGDGVSFEQLQVQVVGLEAEGRTLYRQVLADVVVDAEPS